MKRVLYLPLIVLLVLTCSRLKEMDIEGSYFPAGPGYMWVYQTIYRSYGEGYNVYDTTYDTTYVDIFVEHEDSVYVKYSGWSGAPGLEVFYRGDTVFRYENSYICCRLFPEEGDSIPGTGFPPIEFDSDSTFLIGFKLDSSDPFGEYWIDYNRRQKGVGLIGYGSGHGINYHGDPSQSWGETWISKLVEFNGQEF